MQMEANAFDHEKLDVYRIAIDFVAAADGIASKFPGGRGYLRDQLRRAAVSIPLNIAEGVGKWNPPDKARFFGMARGSAMECAAILDVAGRLELDPDERCAAAKSLLLRIVAMLTKLSRHKRVS
jgi:four helix bundle protein